MAKLLVVDDEKNLLMVVQKEMSRQGHEVETASDGETAWELLEQQDFDVLLCDINMPRLDGIALLRRLREKSQNIPEVIMLTGQATVESAIEAMKLGAYDYLTKPYRITELAALVTQSAEKQMLKIDNQRLRAQIERTHQNMPEIVAESPQMKEVLRLVQRVASSDTSVLITGESGTGKELIARSVHLLSRRSQAPFIPFNCTAAPADLVESLLFGHRKGSFTGAHADSRGLIRAAEGGTLFLDEIGDLPIGLQPKLLRFLQEGEVHTLGEREPRKVNVRVVAATHKDLRRAVVEERFREDLYYRIASLTLDVPPLRERNEDIAALISHYLTHYARRNDRAVAGITAEAIRALQNYSWPGNIRELAAEIERLVLYTDEGTSISIEHISPRVCPPQTATGQGSESASAHLENMLDEFERRVITETLKQYDYNVARAAVALGLGSRQTLYKKLKRLTINVGDFIQDEGQPGWQLRSDKN